MSDNAQVFGLGPEDHAVTDACEALGISLAAVFGPELAREIHREMVKTIGRARKGERRLVVEDASTRAVVSDRLEASGLPPLGQGLVDLRRLSGETVAPVVVLTIVAHERLSAPRPVVDHAKGVLLDPRFKDSDDPVRVEVHPLQWVGSVDKLISLVRKQEQSDAAASACARLGVTLPEELCHELRETIQLARRAGNPLVVEADLWAYIRDRLDQARLGPPGWRPMIDLRRGLDPDVVAAIVVIIEVAHELVDVPGAAVTGAKAFIYRLRSDAGRLRDGRHQDQEDQNDRAQDVGEQLFRRSWRPTPDNDHDHDHLKPWQGSIDALIARTKKNIRADAKGEATEANPRRSIRAIEKVLHDRLGIEEDLTLGMVDPSLLELSGPYRKVFDGSLPGAVQVVDPFAGIEVRDFLNVAYREGLGAAGLRYGFPPETARKVADALLVLLDGASGDAVERGRVALRFWGRGGVKVIFDPLPTVDRKDERSGFVETEVTVIDEHQWHEGELAHAETVWGRIREVTDGSGRLDPAKVKDKVSRSPHGPTKWRNELGRQIIQVLSYPTLQALCGELSNISNVAEAKIALSAAAAKGLLDEVPSDNRQVAVGLLIPVWSDIVRN